MFKFVGVIALVVAVASAGALPRRLDGKIVGGEEIPIETAPYQVSLQRDGKHVCGGSIIAENWVLTAGYCVDPSVRDYDILAGTPHKSRANGGSVHKVVQTIVHQEIDKNFFGTPFNDIAVVRVAEPFKFDNTRKPVELFAQNEELPVGSLSTVTGWGWTGHISPNILHLVNVPIMSKEECRQYFWLYGGLPEKEICAGYLDGGRDSCYGDTGGPLVVDGRLVGIVSWGHGCAAAAKPGVYTEVASYRTWIKENSGV